MKKTQVCANSILLAQTHSVDGGKDHVFRQDIDVSFPIVHTTTKGFDVVSLVGNSKPPVYVHCDLHNRSVDLINGRRFSSFAIVQHEKRQDSPLPDRDCFLSHTAVLFFKE